MGGLGSPASGQNYMMHWDLATQSLCQSTSHCLMLGGNKKSREKSNVYPQFCSPGNPFLPFTMSGYRPTFGDVIVDGHDYLHIYLQFFTSFERSCAIIYHKQCLGGKAWPLLAASRFKNVLGDDKRWEAIRENCSEHSTVWLNLGKTELSERRQSPKTTDLWFHWYAISRIDKSIETGGRLIVASGWRDGEWGVST